MIPSLVSAEEITVYGDDSYAPIIYLKNGVPSGIIPEIFKSLESKTGDTYKLSLTPWSRATVESLRTKSGITNISKNKEREKIYDFSLPIYFDNIQLVVLKGREFKYQKTDDLIGKKIGIATSVAYGDTIDSKIASGALTVERDLSQAARIRKLLHNRIDVAFIGNGDAGLEFILNSEPDLLKYKDKFVALPVPLASDPLHLAFDKKLNMKSVLNRFNKAFLKFSKTSEYKKIISGKN